MNMFSFSLVFLYVLYCAFPGHTVAHRFWVFDYRPCSSPVTQVPGFNISRFLGRWYMLEKFRSSFEIDEGPWRHMDECGRFEFFPSGSGGVNTYIAWEIHSNIRGYPRIRIYCGYVEQRNVSRPEEFSYLTYGLDYPFLYDITVVDTDYISYAVFSSCYSTVARQTWILTRAQGVAPSNLDAIKANLAAQGVETGRLTRVEQEDCKAQAEYDLKYNDNHYCQHVDSIRDSSVGL